MFGIIIFLITVFILSFLFLLVKRVIEKATTPKDVEFSTNLNEFKESHMISNTVKSCGTNWMNGNVSRLYEKMCIEEPHKYEKHPDLKDIIRRYFDYINGSLLDINGTNTPSENILNKPNPHYALYLKNQREAMIKSNEIDKASHLKIELDRVEKVSEASIIRAKFFSHMINRGVDSIIVLQGTTDKKLGTYDENDWSDYITKVKSYTKSEGGAATLAFVTMFDDKSIVLDPSSFAKFVVYFNNDVPDPIIKQIIKGTVTEEQAVRIVGLVQESGYTWSEAIEEVLYKDIEQDKINSLRKQYGFSN